MRNKQKRLDIIIALESKITSNEIEANEDQLAKIANKSCFESEIADLKCQYDQQQSHLNQQHELANKKEKEV